MKSHSEIIESLYEHKSQFQERYPIKSMAIFGSYARNENTPDSDIDILVEFSGDIGIRSIDLAGELEDFLGAKVDLVSKNGIKGKYFEAIKSDLIYV